MSDNPLIALGMAAQQAARVLAKSSTDQKNKVLMAIKDIIATHKTDILEANLKDVAAAKSTNMTEANLDRLTLNDARFDGLLQAIDVVYALPNPVGQVLENVERPNGLNIQKVTVPLGVLGIIFESRPNVALDAAILSLKSGNACVLRGGSDSVHTTQLLVQLMRQAIDSVGLPANCVQTLPTQDRALVGAMLQLTDYIDVIIPRGGKNLVARVQAESRVPVFSHLDGICHTYIDTDADRQMAIDIVLNAKLRRTGVCGATECVLLHKNIAHSLGKDILQALLDKNCEVRVPQSLLVLDNRLKLADSTDYGHEFLSATLAVSVVDDVLGAVAFINQHGSGHTDAIITNNNATAQNFLKGVKSAIAVHNASTQFADGGEFGKGAEIGIATGKLHARGPVGLNELVTYQYHVLGCGQTRPV
jgi:glutamate-5-semialdehyde dehydrogenase